MSRYLQKMFKRDFDSGCEFWTGEDGMLISFAIVRRPDWAKVLYENYNHCFENEAFDASRGRERFAYRARIEDREDWPGRRTCWRIGEEKTDYPVIEYELIRPQ